MKTRGINIKRTVKEEVIENGKPVEKKVKKWFRCKINASIPFEHKLCENQ